MSHLVFRKIKTISDQDLVLFLTVSCVLVQSLLIHVGKSVGVQWTSNAAKEEKVNLVLPKFRELGAEMWINVGGSSSHENNWSRKRNFCSATCN